MSTQVIARAPQLIVRRRSDKGSAGVLQCGPLTFPCALGRAGIRVTKWEGDGATPFGRFALREVYFNPSAVTRPVTVLPVRAIRTSDGWCDAPGDRNYNRRVRHPYEASAERLWRDDGLYDVVVVLDYNILPRRRGRGSAIFMHVARPGYQPTQGCIALKRCDLLKILARVRPATALITSR